MAVSLARNAGSRDTVTASFEGYDADREPAMRPTPYQAFVRVMMGCDKFCTYCIVPSVRGPEQSRPPEAILGEVRLLAAQGVQGDHAAGPDGQQLQVPRARRPDRAALRPALPDSTTCPGIERIKFITSFPNDMTDDLLQAVRDLPQVSRYIHVPAQSGCDEVLKRMKRMYTVAFYEEMLARIRETVPGVAVSSDFIVGFCGETEESFDRTVRPGRAGPVQEQLHLQVQPAAGDEGRRPVSPTTCPRRSRSGGTTTCWRCRRPSAVRTTGG